MPIDESETVALTATFRDEAGSLTDPLGPVEVTVQGPSGLVVSAAPATRKSVGVYEHKITVTEPGIYRYQFESADGAVEQDTYIAQATI